MSKNLWTTEQHKELCELLGYFENDAVSFGLHMAQGLYKSKHILFKQWCKKKDPPKKYIYLVTFTLRPEHHEDEIIHKLAQSHIEGIAKRDALLLTYFSFVKEHTKAGVPHWHAVIVSENPIKKNRFQYYEKLYGNIDISRTKGQTTQPAIDYISKEGIPTILINNVVDK